MAEAKHSFVDDNPYLVYSPKAETTYDGNSGGGGGGDTSIFKITVDPETNVLSEKAGDLATMCVNGLVYFIMGNIELGFNVVYLLATMQIERGSYSFNFAFFTPGETSVQFQTFTASSADDYPVYNEGE